MRLNPELPTVSSYYKSSKTSPTLGVSYWSHNETGPASKMDGLILSTKQCLFTRILNEISSNVLASLNVSNCWRANWTCRIPWRVSESGEVSTGRSQNRLESEAINIQELMFMFEERQDRRQDRWADQHWHCYWSASPALAQEAGR